MRQFYELLAANFKMTVRNKQALFWLFLFPVMLMALFGIAFAGGEPTPGIALVDLDKSAMTRGMREGFTAAKIVKLRTFSSVKHAKSELSKGNVDGVIVLRRGTQGEVQEALASRNRAIVQKTGIAPASPPTRIDFYYDPSNTFVSGVARGITANVVDGIDRKVGGSPKLLELKNHSVRQRNLRYIDFLVPGIIAMTLMNSAMFGLGGTIVSYRERGILRRLKVTPQPLTMFVSAQIVNQLAFSILRALMLILVARVLFDVRVLGSYFALLAVILAGSLTFVTIAFAVASFSKNREIADSIGNLLTMPMMFLGGVFFPVENAPAWIQPLIKALPLKYLADAARAVMIKGEGLAAVRLDLAVLFAITLVFFAVSAWLWRWE